MAIWVSELVQRSVAVDLQGAAKVIVLVYIVQRQVDIADRRLG
jgi:hypothetical protein